MKYEKLTFTPVRLIEIERTSAEGEEPWANVVLKAGREVTFGPFRDFLDDDDWYIDCGRIYRVLHCDVELVYAQLTMEAEEAAKRKPTTRDPSYPPLPVDVWSAELMFAGMSATDNPMCFPLVWVFRHREQAMPDQRIYTQYVGPAENQPRIREGEARQLAATRLTAERAAPTLGEAKMFGLPTSKPGRLRARYDLTPRKEMIDTIIARQVEQGGVDTEGSRHEAERWCAFLAACVCEGMRATTTESAYGLVPGQECKGGDVAWWRTAPEFGARRMFKLRGKPLGRP